MHAKCLPHIDIFQNEDNLQFLYFSKNREVDANNLLLGGGGGDIK